MSDEPKPIREVFIDVSNRAAALESLSPGSIINPEKLLAEAQAINRDFLAIIERLAMAGSTLHAAHRLTVLKIEEQDRLEPEGYALPYQAVLAQSDSVSEAFADEIAFIRTVNLMISNQMLRAEGIDPNDARAVKEHVRRNIP